MISENFRAEKENYAKKFAPRLIDAIHEQKKTSENTRKNTKMMNILSKWEEKR